MLIREHTTIGDRVSVGSSTIIEGECTSGTMSASRASRLFPTHTTVGNQVFIGPHAILTNDRYPPFGRLSLVGPVLEDRVTIGANAIILPGIHIGTGSAVAAGSIVTRDVPPGVLALSPPCTYPRSAFGDETMRRIYTNSSFHGSDGNAATDVLQIPVSTGSAITRNISIAQPWIARRRSPPLPSAAIGHAGRGPGGKAI